MAAHVMAHRGPGSIFGRASAPLKGPDGGPLEFPTLAEAQAEAARLNARATPNVHYQAEEGPPTA
jgi:hypothetical protein